jgi:hypothetical protein
MLRFNEILLVFGILVGFATSSVSLKYLEKFTGQLAVTTAKRGYMNLDSFNRQLTGQKR